MLPLADNGDSREIRFSLYSNYSAFIERTEIRLFKTSDSTMQRPLKFYKPRSMAQPPGTR